MSPAIGTSVTFTDEEEVPKPRVGVNYEGNKLYAPMGLGWHETKKGLFSGIYKSNFPALLGLSHYNPVTPSVDANTTFSFKADLDSNTWSIYIKSSVPGFFRYQWNVVISFVDYTSYTIAGSIGQASLNKQAQTYYNSSGLVDGELEYSGTFSSGDLTRLRSSDKLLFNIGYYAIPCVVENNKIQIDDSIEFYETNIASNYVMAKGNYDNSSKTHGGVVSSNPPIIAYGDMHIVFPRLFDYFDGLIENIDFYYLSRDCELVKFKEGFTNSSGDVPFQLNAGYVPAFFVNVTVEGKSYWGIIECNYTITYTGSGRPTYWSITLLYNSEEMNKLVKK